MDCNDIKKVNRFRFKHKSTQRQFVCNSTVDDYFLDNDTNKPREIVLEFDDLLEVNTLILALDRFRNDCQNNIGTWEYKNDETVM